MQIQPKKIKYELKRSVGVGFALFLIVVIGVGCVTHAPSLKQQAYIEIKGGQNSGKLPWFN